MDVIKLAADCADFAAAKRLADARAEALLGEPFLLSWYDRGRDIESPKGVSACNPDSPAHNVVRYAAHRDGALVVDIDAGRYLFCYRLLGEFSDPD